jgi:hypothetical protein
MIRLFLSHSSSDIDLVELLADLFRSALRLSAQEIRCTSVDGFRLPAGSTIDDQLRTEIVNAPAFVAVVSPPGFESAYMLFELGARWGCGSHFALLLAPGVTAATLQGPAARLNALNCTRSNLYQLLSELAAQLGVQAEPPAVYDRIVERILSLPGYSAGVSASKLTTPSRVQQNSPIDLLADGPVIKSQPPKRGV